MRATNEEFEFHQESLTRVCNSFASAKRGTDWLVTGPRGIGKTRFLEHIRTRLSKPDWADRFCFRHVLFGGRAIQQKNLESVEWRTLRKWLDSDAPQHDKIAIYFMDDIEDVCGYPNEETLPFFKALAEYRDQRNLAYIVASQRPLLDQIDAKFPREQSLRDKLAMDRVGLGLLPRNEAEDYIRSKGVRDANVILRAGGCYPDFLVVAVGHDTSARDVPSLATELKRTLSEKYGIVWNSLEIAEKEVLYQLAENPDSVKGNDAILNVLRSKALVQPKENALFSEAFRLFVCERKPSRKEHVLARISSVGWNRDRSLSAMLALMLVYAIAVLIVRVFLPTGYESIIGVLFVVFALLFVVLMFVYSNLRPKV